MDNSAEDLLIARPRLHVFDHFPSTLLDVPAGDSLHVVHHVFMARIDDETLDHSGMNSEELSVVTGARWWSIEELLAEQPDVRPPGFVELVAEVVRGVRGQTGQM